MFQTNELLDIKQASIWASKHIGKNVTPSNITYPINYRRINKPGNARKFLAEDFDISLSPMTNTIFTRISTEVMKQINTDDLIYWIDKDFVQNTAQERIGRSLNDEEILQLTKMVEFGLWEAVNISVKTAIDEVSQ